MVAQTRTATLDDLANTPDDGRIYELIDGEIIVAAAPTIRHELVSQLLNLALLDWVRENERGLALTAPTDVVLTSGTAFQPDLFYFADDNPGEIVDGRFHGAPDLVVEILSPTSRSRDSIVKSMRYARAGVREFWLVDPEFRTIAVFDAEDGLWSERPTEADGALVSGVMAGLRVEPATLFADVERMLARRRPAG